MGDKTTTEDGNVTESSNISDDNINAEKTDDSTSIKVADGPEAGTKLSYKKYYYKVTKAGATDGTITGELQVTGLRKKSVTIIKIAKTVKINGVTYKVTSIAKKALKGTSKKLVVKVPSVKKKVYKKKIKKAGNK